MVRKRSCPAVSQICSFTFLPLMSIVLILKSIPIVVMNVGLKVSFAYRNNKQVLPTPAASTEERAQWSSSNPYAACPNESYLSCANRRRSASAE